MTKFLKRVHWELLFLFSSLNLPFPSSCLFCDSRETSSSSKPSRLEIFYWINFKKQFDYVSKLILKDWRFWSWGMTFEDKALRWFSKPGFAKFDNLRALISNYKLKEFYWSTSRWISNFLRLFFSVKLSSENIASGARL